MNIQNSSAPLIARLGGISCDVIAGFHTQLGEQLDFLIQLETELRNAQKELVDCLYQGICGAVGEKRYALIAVKRDCFNGRTLAPYRQSADWQFVEEVAAAQAHRVLEFETQVDAAKNRFIRCFDEEAGRQQQHLATLLEDPLLASGLAIASPVVAREVSRLRAKPPQQYGRRERRLTATLLRYLSRAALKLSPFSTFTAVGLAELQEGDGFPVLVGKDRQRHSLVRLRRNILDRCSDMLLRYPPWRDRLQVRLNDSVFTLDDGRVLYRRPGYYQPSEEAGKLAYHEESLVRVRLQGPLIEYLKSLLPHQVVCYRQLKSMMAAQLGTGIADPAMIAHLDRLIEIGFLHLSPPWSSDTGHLEKIMLQEFRQLPPDQALEPFLDDLQRLIELEDGFLAAKDAVGCFHELDALIDRLLQSAAALCGLSSKIDVTRRLSEHEIYQDVWCSPQKNGQHEIVRLGRSTLDQALRSVEPLVKFTQLYNHRIEFLFTLGVHLRQRSEKTHFSVLEVFDCAQALWRDYMKFQMHARNQPEAWRSTWNPLGLALLQELASWRESVHRGITSCLVHSPDGQQIDIQRFNALLRPVPQRFIEDHGGACLFLQAASKDGSLWMLNRMKEGTGRFGSRYSPLMPAALQEYYTTQLSCRGTYELEGETVELLDVYCVLGDTINVHALQTPKVLILGGETINVPESRHLALQDLAIVIDQAGWPRLRDRHGRRYLPVHLGVGYHDYLPTMVKFLCTFGPTEMGAVFPPPLECKRDGIVVQERTMIGNVVLHRKSWKIPLDELRPILQQSSEAGILMAVHQWRRRRGLPERVFAIERVPHPILGFRYQPQYLDFTSPLFLAILRSVAASPDHVVSLVEMLPTPDLFPQDENGEKWALELLVDSLALKSRCNLLQ